VIQHGVVLFFFGFTQKMPPKRKLSLQLPPKKKRVKIAEVAPIINKEDEDDLLEGIQRTQQEFQNLQESWRELESQQEWRTIDERDVAQREQAQSEYNEYYASLLAENAQDLQSSPERPYVVGNTCLNCNGTAWCPECDTTYNAYQDEYNLTGSYQ